MSELTPRQSQILNFIRACIAESGMPPTRAEIAAELGFRSPNAAEEHLRALQRKGAIDLLPGASRGIQLKDVLKEQLGLPLIGRVAAGNPILAEENIEDHVRIDPAMFHPEPHYLLRVQGMSMKNAGILDGDVAIFEQRQHAENGDIVVAILNDEGVTLKRFYKERNRVKLKAENPIYPPIYTQNVRVLGKLSCIIRNYD